MINSLSGVPSPNGVVLENKNVKILNQTYYSKKERALLIKFMVK